MSKFRVALSSDFIKPDGNPAFPMFDLSPLVEHPDVEHVFLRCEGEIDAVEIAEFDALILLVHRFTRQSVPANDRLAVVARFGVGYDTVDVPACTDNGIALCITPDGVRRPVAVSVMALILALTGKMMVKDAITRGGPARWGERIDHMGVGLVGKTLGAVGLGNIGAEVFRLAKPFDMTFIAHDPYADPGLAQSLGVELVSMDEVFRRSDILTLHCFLNDATRGLVNAERLAMMKPTAYLINTSRGPVVDQAALTDALQRGVIAGAGLDVLEQEPPAADDPILALDNVILAPHALCWTDECFAGNGAADIQAVLDVMRGHEPRGVVNREVLQDQRWQQKLKSFRERFGA